MLRTYIDWLLDVPWSVTTDRPARSGRGARVLDEDHYDLDKVKERIVEYLAVRKLKGDMKGPILCFVGPPGVGKTSLGQSIARAMSRKFVRISLGGVRDEAEIRGHRRTYIGSMPGRIVQALKQAGSMNPVFMLDEIDKMRWRVSGRSGRGAARGARPGAEPHVPRPLPRDARRPVAVLFIATANQLGTVHPALLDRMEIIRCRATPRRRRCTSPALPAAAPDRASTGCRRWRSRSTDARCASSRVHARGRRPQPRAAARHHRAQGGRRHRQPAGDAPKAPDGRGPRPIRSTSYLGPARFKKEVAFRTSRPGVATGVAWTETGGDVLFIEATLLPGGNQNIILTGQLGNVMQESARAALSHLRAHAAELGISAEFLASTTCTCTCPPGRFPRTARRPG
jgi:ATP-dependent Lon protease